MSNIAVNFSAFNNHEAALLRCETVLTAKNIALMMIRAGVDSAVSSRNAIGPRLKKAGDMIADCVAGAHSLRSACNKAEACYRQTERKINDNVSGGARRSDIISYIAKACGLFGIGGGFFSAMLNKFDGKTLDLGKTIIGIIGKGAKMAEKGTAISWASIFGYTDDTAKSFFESLKSQVKGYAWKSGSEAHNVGTIAKWGGIVLVGIGSFIGNYTEFDGDIKSKRMWQETVTETALGIGKQILLTAAVGGCVAAVIGSAPALPVALAVGGIDIIADIVSKNITGVGFTEMASDFILDTSEQLSAITSGIAESALETIGGTVKAITSGMSSAWNSIMI